MPSLSTTLPHEARQEHAAHNTHVTSAAPTRSYDGGRALATTTLAAALFMSAGGGGVVLLVFVSVEAKDHLGLIGR